MVRRNARREYAQREKTTSMTCILLEMRRVKKQEKSISDRHECGPLTAQLNIALSKRTRWREGRDEEQETDVDWIAVGSFPRFTDGKLLWLAIIRFHFFVYHLIFCDRLFSIYVPPSSG